MAGRSRHDGRAGNPSGGDREERGFFFAGEHQENKRNVRKASIQDPGAWWGHVNTLITHGHGPLPNVLNYTLPQINSFLAEIDSAKRREYKETIFAHRISQADKKHFQDAIRRLDQQERQIRALRRKQYRAEGKTKQEAEWLVKHTSNVHASELSQRERSKLDSEINAMWETIPPEFRERAGKMAGR